MSRKKRRKSEKKINMVFPNTRSKQRESIKFGSDAARLRIFSFPCASLYSRNSRTKSF